jgi:RNA-splicing ligase RtcB
MNNNFPWKQLKGEAQKFCVTYHEETGIHIRSPKYSMLWFEEMCDRIGINIGYAIKSIGTLGAGNHFIEFGECVETSSPWVTIHSGSRNLGKKVCEYWQGVANKKMKKSVDVDMKEEIKHMKSTVKDKTKYKQYIDEIKIKYHSGTDKGLAFLTGDDSYNYMFDMLFAQKYAEINRLEILKAISSAFGDDINLLNGRCIESIHNYISPTDLIIRKGAIESYKDEYQVIPFNMRDGILIVEGKSNTDWNCSAPHGAGRLMSRGEAKRKLNFDVFKKQMTGIYSTSVTESTLDEAPDAYKDSKVIEEAIEPTCKIMNRIKPILNLKDLNDKPSWAEMRKDKKFNRKKKR